MLGIWNLEYGDLWQVCPPLLEGSIMRCFMSNRCCSGSGLSYSEKLICLYIGKRVSLHYTPETAGYSSDFLASRKEIQLSLNCSTTIEKYLCVHLQFFLTRTSQIRHSLHEEGKIKKRLLLLLPPFYHSFSIQARNVLTCREISSV